MLLVHINVKCREQGLSSSGFKLVMAAFGETQYENVSSGIIPVVLLVLHIHSFRAMDPSLC